MAASVQRDIMTLITQAVMVRATIDVNRMNAQQKVQLADEIFAQQPNLLASVLVLPRFGVDTLQLEVPIHVLLVTFQAMTPRWPGQTAPLMATQTAPGRTGRIMQ